MDTYAKELGVTHRALLATITGLIGRIQRRAQYPRWRQHTDRFDTVIALLRLAAWYLTAPEVPPMRYLTVGHVVGTVAEVAAYADLYGRKPYGDRKQQADIWPNDIGPGVVVYVSSDEQGDGL